MSGVLGQVRAGIRRRRLQTSVIATIVLLASGTITLGLTLLQTASDPWDSAFRAQKGAHLAVTYDGRHVTADQLRATPSLIQATASAGPWPATSAQFAWGRQKYQLNVIGRNDPGGPVEALNLVAGRWAGGPGEIVVTRSFAELNRVRLDDRLTSISTPDQPVFQVVGEAVDIDEGDARTSSQSIWMTEAQAAAFSLQPGFRMVYRFAQDPTDAQLRDRLATLRASLPPGAVSDSVNYLLFRRIFTVVNQILLTFLIAFGIFALLASAATVVNLVTGIVLASYREIGILKAIGFTPGQVTAAISGQMLLPALAGALVGVPAGALLSVPLVAQAADGLGLASQPGISPLAALAALAGTLLVALAAAALPALRAGRLNAVRAIILGSAPPAGRASRLGGRLARIGVPRPVSLGVADALRRPLRGALTGVAVLLGVAALVFATGLQRSTATFAARASLADTVDVIVQRTDAYPDDRLATYLDAQPETERVVAAAGGQALLPGLADPVEVTAFRGDSRQLGIPVVTGRWYGGPGEVLAPRATLDEAHLRVGDSVTVTIAGAPVTVLVVGEVFSLTNLGHELVMDQATLAAAAPDLAPHTYYVKLRPGSNASAFADRVHSSEPDFLSVQLTSTSSVSTADIFNSVIAAVAAVLGLIALASVFNTMLLNTRERRHDVAILKTLGMTPRQLLVMVASTACALGAVAGLLGVPAGVAVHRGLLAALGDFSGNDLPPVAFDVFTPPILFALGLTGLAFALLGSLLPAYWAARAGVAEVQHTE